MIDNIEASNPFAEVTELITRWKETIKLGIYRMTGGRWKRYHEPKFLCNEREVREERLQQLTNYRRQRDLRKRIGPQHRGGFQPRTGHRTMDSRSFLADAPANPSPIKPSL